MKAFFVLIVILGILGWLLGFEVLVSTFAENPVGWIPALIIATTILHVLFFASSEKPNPSANPVSQRCRENFPQNTDGFGGDNRALQKARQQRKLTKSQRKQMVFDLHKKEPEMSVSEVARRVGVSPQTVKGYYKEMGVDTEKENLLNNYSKNTY